MAVSVSRKQALSVQARAAATKPVKAVTRPVKAARSGNSLAILSRVQELRLLSQVEKLGLLSKLEKSGLTLSKIESSGLLSLTEKTGVLTLLADEATPGLLSATGGALLFVSAALIYASLSPNTDAAAIEAVGAAVMSSLGLAVLFAGSTLGSIQRL